MQDRTQELTEALREAGLRCTAPRLRLIRLLAGLPRHFSAEEALHELNAEEEPAVSRATVYRFLGELERLGVLRRAQLSEGHGHYEFAETQPEHCHLVCARCGRVVEVPSPALQRQVRRLAREQGFGTRAVAVEITVGCCEQCSGQAGGGAC
jgi:Fur family ferric uptake transcriptional regulator